MCDSDELTARVNERTAIVAHPRANREAGSLRQTANDLLDLVAEDSVEMVRSESPLDEPRTLLDLASSCSRRLDHLDVHDLLILTIARQRDRPSTYESDKDFRPPKLSNEDPSQPQEWRDSQPRADDELVTSGLNAGEKTPLLSSDEGQIDDQLEDEGAGEGEGLEEDRQQLITS